MSNQDQSEIVVSIRKKQENIALTIGVIFAMTLSVYFFTYAMVTDKGLTNVLWAMGISSVVIVAMLFRLQSVAFFVARLWLGRREGYQDVLASMSATKE